MSVIPFRILNPVTNSKLPFIDKYNTFYFPIKATYHYYMECSDIDEQGLTKYYLLLSDINFDNNCRRCSVDNYGRCKLKPKGELLNYIKAECKDRGNINCDYCYTVENGDDYHYDVYEVV